MCLKSSLFHHQGCSLRGQNGAGLPLAIFLITVMVLIVATIARLQQSAAEAEALDIQSARALNAAESALQAHFADIFPDEDGETVPCEVNSFEFETSGLSGCSAEVSCVQEDEGNEGNEPPARVFESRGECGSGPDRAVRTVEVRAQ